MTEKTTLEIIAPTVEQALAQGLDQLGLPATAVSVEVLDSGSSGLFGLGSRQVRVRLTVNPPEGAPMAPFKPVAAEAPAKAQPRGGGRKNDARAERRARLEAGEWK
jgi:spoIIIJ-associated protein